MFPASVTPGRQRAPPGSALVDAAEARAHHSAQHEEVAASRMQEHPDSKPYVTTGLKMVRLIKWKILESKLREPCRGRHVERVLLLRLHSHPHCNVKLRCWVPCPSARLAHIPSTAEKLDDVESFRDMRHAPIVEEDQDH